MRIVPAVIRQLFWGYLLVMFDVRVAGFELLTPIGYLLLLLGTRNLARLFPGFIRAKILAGFLAVLSIPVWFIPEFNLLTDSITASRLAVFVYTGMLLRLLHLFFVYEMLSGLQGMAEEKGIQSLADKMERWRKRYAVIMLTSLIAAPFIINLASNQQMFLIPVLSLGVFALDLVILILFGLFRKRWMCDEAFYQRKDSVSNPL